MEMTGMPVGRLVAEPALAEIDLAGDACADHALQGAVDGRAADTGGLAPDELDELVGADMPFLCEKDGDDLVALARPLAAGRNRNVQTVIRR
jgi:hypothetical protein